MGTPVVTFTIESGWELERALPFAAEVNGESSYNIRYKASTDEIIVTDVYIVVKIIGLIIFFVIAVVAEHFFAHCYEFSELWSGFCVFFIGHERGGVVSPRCEGIGMFRP